jgi:hypothetical protein
MDQNILQLWLSMSWGAKLANIFFLIVCAYMLLWSGLQFIKGLIKNNSKIRIGRHSVEISPNTKHDTSSTTLKELLLNKEQLAPVEHKLLNLIEEQELQKQEELTELRGQILELQNQLVEVRTLLKLKEQEELQKKRMLIPLSQHEFFTEIGSIIEQGISVLPLDSNSDVVKVTRVFIEDCVLNTYRKELHDFVSKLVSEVQEDSKLESLYNLPKLVYQWQDKYMEYSKTIRILLKDGYVLYGVPDSLIKNYQQWSSDYISFLFDKIKSIIFSSFYTTWQLRMIVVMDLYSTIFSLILRDINKAFENITLELNSDIIEKKSII